MTFFRKIWAVYGFSMFFLLWILFFPFLYLAFLILPKSRHRQIIWFLHHVYTRIFFLLTLIFVNVRGEKKLDRDQGYIIVSNHVSPIDFMANALAFPRAYKYLAKIELSKVPVFGFIVKRLCVLVDRRNPESRRSSITYLQKTLAEGYSIFLYPEGTRNKSEELLQSFQKGAFRLAIQTQTPIAIQTITKVRNVSGKGNFNLSPGVLTIIWSDPIPTAGLELKDLPLLIEKTRQIMEHHLLDNEVA